MYRSGAFPFKVGPKGIIDKLASGHEDVMGSALSGTDDPERICRRVCERTPVR